MRRTHKKALSGGKKKVALAYVKYVWDYIY